jgi:hypothetical protein
MDHATKLETYLPACKTNWATNFYVLLDDSVMEKKKPSSHATHGIAGTGFHFSHSKGKSVWEHNLVMVLVRCGIFVCLFPFDCTPKVSAASI